MATAGARLPLAGIVRYLACAASSLARGSCAPSEVRVDDCYEEVLNVLGGVLCFLSPLR